MARVDLTVRGGGIFGLSIAWACLGRGARVRLIETVAIGAGSSGGLVGALAPHVPESWNEKKQFQLESLLMCLGKGLGPKGKEVLRQRVAVRRGVVKAKARKQSQNRVLAAHFHGTRVQHGVLRSTALH
ncbi:MAG: FAD-binding oxidoreductase, partial [Tabrizicola sp.]|nr:FAD-binding oxidoreductase [Tabrizicola sp.]